MNNAALARLLMETADLMEIDGADGFRIRSFRNAADAVEQSTLDVSSIASDAARLQEISGIGKGMATRIQTIVETGTLPQREELLKKFGPGVSQELRKLPGMGPKTIALFWSAAKIGSVEQLAEAIEAGHLASLPRMGAKQVEKLRKGIVDYRRRAGPQFRLDQAEEAAERITEYLLAFKGIEKVTPAGSLRRGRETAGDLDLLVTGRACEPNNTGTAVEYVAAFPGIHDIIVKGENKVSFHPRQRAARSMSGCCLELVYGAALQYFTGSKAHNVVLRQRALKMGYTLNEWALARLDDRLESCCGN